MSQTKMLENVNALKLQAAVESRGYTMSGISKKLGYCTDYLTNSGRHHRMSMACSILLDNVYGIKPQEYVDVVSPQKPKPVAKAPQADGPLKVEFTDDQWEKIERLVKEVIAQTVKDTVTESVKETFENL